jgi:membrane-associated phospholipid phosphatase
MAFTLVYSGEHYVFDIVTGWIYASVVFFGINYIRRRRAPAASTSEQPLPPQAEAAPVAVTAP